jgi:tetratricopeptide (TPR) repeat protein
MMKLAVVFALGWFLYLSVVNRPSPPAPELRSAARALKSNNVALARGQFDRFLNARPDNAAAYVEVCLLCQEARRFDLMTEYAQRGLHALSGGDSADRAQLYAQLAVALSQSGKVQPAQAAARQAKDLDPENPEILNLAGYVLADTSTNLDDLKNAETMIVQALKTLTSRVGAEDPMDILAVVEDSYGWVLYKQGQYYKQSGPPERATEYYARAVTALVQATADLQEPTDPQVAKTIYYHLGAAYRQTGQLDAARDALAVALHYDPQDAEALAEQRLLAPTAPALHPTSAFTPLQAPPASTQIKL